MLKLGLERSPGDSLAPVLIERGKAVVQLGLLCSGQGKLLVFQAVPKLRDERKSLGRSQACELVMGKYIHVFTLRKNAEPINGGVSGGQKGLGHSNWTC